MLPTPEDRNSQHPSGHSSRSGFAQPSASLGGSGSRSWPQSMARLLRPESRHWARRPDPMASVRRLDPTRCEIVRTRHEPPRGRFRRSGVVRRTSQRIRRIFDGGDGEVIFASSAKGLSESGTGARAHLFRSEEASTPPERVTRKPCCLRYFERTSMGGLEPPTPAFGGQCSIQLSYMDRGDVESGRVGGL